MEKKKVLKILGIILAVIVIILAVYVVRNMMIINEIDKKQEELSKYNNYSYTIKGNTGTSSEIYHKDEIEKIITKEKEHTLIIWHNENTKETIQYSPTTRVAYVQTDDIYNSVPKMIKLDTNSVMVKFFSFISSSEIDGEECYVVKCNGDTTYISKERWVVLKRKGGKILKNGVETIQEVEYKDWKFNELTNEDVERPDLTGYIINK